MKKMNWSQALPFAAFFALLAVGFSGCGGGGASTTGGGPGGGPGGGTTGGTVLRGFIRNDFGTGAPNILVQFFSNTGSIVASGFTDVNGRYDVPVTTLPTRLNLLRSSISNVAYYRTYEFRGLWYIPDQANCRAPLPPITPDVVNNLPQITVLLRSSPPPPPPSGCP